MKTKASLTPCAHGSLQTRAPSNVRLCAVLLVSARGQSLEPALAEDALQLALEVGALGRIARLAQGVAA
jgi:hypothetical protein